MYLLEVGLEPSRLFSFNFLLTIVLFTGLEIIVLPFTVESVWRLIITCQSSDVSDPYG